MGTKGISVQASRFALLKVEDDEDSDEQEATSKQKNGKINKESQASKKKKNKKKKAEAMKAENAELRNLAFGAGKGKGKGGKNHSGAGDNPKQWDEWQKVDQQYTSEAYEKDLQQALLMSKIDFEEKKDVLGAVQDDPNNAQGGKGQKKKKKAAMTLDEFNQMPVETATSRQNSECEEYIEVLPPKLKPNTTVEEPDPKFFKAVEDDAAKIIRKEKIQEEYQKQYIVENARTLQYRNDIEERDKEIEQLKENNKKLETELKGVKKRNQQLCHILAQGEMKDKTSVLLEVEQLQTERDELTQEVADLNTQLEKERSKVHQLKSELEKGEKQKGGKHAGK